MVRLSGRRGGHGSLNVHLQMEAIQLVATQLAYCRHFLLLLAKVAPSPVAQWYLHWLIQYHGVDNLHEPCLCLAP